MLFNDYLSKLSIRLLFLLVSKSVSLAITAQPASPAAGPIPPVPPTLENQTVRMFLRTSIAVESVRLYFSNSQGLPTVTLGSIHLAVSTRCGDTDPASDRKVTFSGRNSVTLYSGAIVVSDPVVLTVNALSELALSDYLPNNTYTRGKHELALNTTYIATGDQTAVTDFTASETNRTWFWLTGMDVLAPAEAGPIVAVGDYITDDFSTTPDQRRAWPAMLAERLQQIPATVSLGVLTPATTFCATLPVPVLSHVLIGKSCLVQEST